MGYCQTGRHPLVFAAEQPITAAVVWYGAAAKREWEVTQAAAEGARRHHRRGQLPGVRRVRRGRPHHLARRRAALPQCLESHKKTYDIHLYRGAPHGWLNDTMPGRYRKPQAEAGWAAQQRFLREVFAASGRAMVRWQFESESSVNYDFSKNVRME